MLLDPAMLQDIQAAIVPPPMPPALTRAWKEPAPTGAAVTAFLDAAEVRLEQWRANLEVWTGAFGRCRDVPRSAGELAALDRTFRNVKGQARSAERDAERRLKRRMRWHKEVAERDATAGRIFLAQMRRMHGMQLSEAETLNRLAVAIDDYRRTVDYRGRAVFGDEERDFHPNAETIAAMEEARVGVGMRRTTSIADLMAELHAEGD